MRRSLFWGIFGASGIYHGALVKMGAEAEERRVRSGLAGIIKASQFWASNPAIVWGSSFIHGQDTRCVVGTF